MENRKKHKIVFIHPDLGIGGAERLVLDVAVALAEKGNEVLFVTNHFDKVHAFQELQDGQFPVRVVGDWIPRSVCGICQALCAYLRMIFLALVYVLFIRKEEKPDIYFIDQIPMAVPFIKWTGGKVIYYCHHPDLLASPPGGKLKNFYRMPINWLELKGTGLADIILVNSKYTASVFRKTFPQITKDIHILYPTISASYQSNIENYNNVKTINELVPEIKVAKNQIIFLSINRYHPAKNLELALNGLEALRNKLSSNDWQRVHLIIAGGYDPQSAINSKYFTNLVAKTQEKNLTTKVTFLKSLSDDLKVDLLLACNCLIYTPINEHFGIVPLEAMIAAKPVIACNSGGPCETIENGVTGFLCEPNADSMATAMSKFLDENNSTKMGLEGKNRLQKYFSHSVFINSVNNVVDNVLGEGLDQSSDLFPKQEDEGSNVSQEVSVSEEKTEVTIKDSGSVAEKKDDSKDNLSPQKEKLNDVQTSSKNEEVKSQSLKESETGEMQITKTEEQSPDKVEIQTEKVINDQSLDKSSDKDSASNETQSNVSELKNNLLIDDKTETSPTKCETKLATTNFLQNEIKESINDTPPHENVLVADETLPHNQ